MKKPLNYPELWQKKQRGLPVKGNPDEQWLRVNAILDKRMPVTNLSKKPFRFKVPKWGLKVLIVVSSSVAVYVGGRLYFSKNQQDAVKPNILQIHRDPVTPAANDSSSTQPFLKPSMVSTPGIKPVTDGADRRFTGQNPVNNNGQKTGQPRVDSIKPPAILNMPIHRDSLLMPMEASQLKPVRDSITPVVIEKRDIPKKDTSNNSKKTPKKRKRRKVSVFF